jgi:hypothetical protein
MAFEDKTLEELAKDYTDGLVQYEEFLAISKELLKTINSIRSSVIEMEEELIHRGVEIKNVRS